MTVLKSRYATIKDLTKSIYEAEERYYLLHNEYTNNFENLDIDMPENKVGTSTNSIYYYDWGYCTVSNGNDTFFACHNYMAKMRYNIHLRIGNILCISEGADLQSPQAKICSQETNNNFWTCDSSCYWYYN